MAAVWSQQQRVDQRNPDVALSGLISLFRSCFALEVIVFHIASLMQSDILGKAFPVTSCSLVIAQRSSYPLDTGDTRTVDVKRKLPWGKLMLDVTGGSCSRCLD